MTPTNILAFVLAGGKGTRLRPLTAKQPKPAVPFANGCRIVDFALSNLVNSGISPIYVLAQYKPHPLIEHLRMHWGVGSGNCPYLLDVVLPRRDGGVGYFRGTADAVYQNLNLIERHCPDLVGVFAADHIYRMDVRQMAVFHRQHHADVSVAAVPVPLEEASSFGIIDAGADGRVQEFREKPQRPAAIPARPTHAYASMGNYLFEPQVLIDVLTQAARCTEYDFGRDLFPRLSRTHRTYAYDFAANRVPGCQPYEERGYWRDVGTIESYRAAQNDVVGPRPRFRLCNLEWPIRGQSADQPTNGYGHTASQTTGVDTASPDRHAESIQCFGRDSVYARRSPYEPGADTNVGSTDHA